MVKILSGYLYVEKDNPDCDKAIQLYEKLKDIVYLEIVDVDEQNKRSELEEELGFLKLPLLEVPGLSMFPGWNAIRAYLAPTLKNHRL